MGIHRTFPSEVATLPTCYMGLGLPHPYIECGIARIITFINNMGSKTLTSKFLAYSVQLLQLEIGLINDVLTQDFQQWGVLATDSWIKSLWEFASRFKIKLHAPHRILPHIVRQGDKGIMEEFID